MDRILLVVAVSEQSEMVVKTDKVVSVRCDYQSKLNVSNHDIDRIDGSIGQLVNLTQLDCSNNQLTTLPDTIGNLVNLTQLHCDDNQLTTLPDIIGNLVKLTHLNCRTNQLTTLPDTIGNLVNLTELYCSSNNLTTLPDTIGNLVNLTQLYCRSNKLTTLPDTIGNLVNLTLLYCWSNQLTTLPNTIGNLVDLTQLNCSWNKLTTLPDTIGNLVSLTYLNCRSNQFTTLPDTIGNLVNLTQLHCDDNQLTTLPDIIGNLVNLTQLDCSDNQLTTLPDTIGNLVNLTQLGCNENQLTTLPDTIGNLVNLTQVDCDDNQLTTLPDTIGNLVNLTQLNCRGNQLTTLPDTIGNLVNLTQLHCRSNQLTTLPDTIGNLVNLRYLNWDNASSERGVYWDINQNCKLQSVENSCKIDTQVTAVDKILNVSGRRITKVFVPNNPIDSIETLDLSQNELQALPKTLFKKFPNLKHLHIQGNTLSTLPEEWESNKLETLDCSFNRLISLPDNIENKFPKLTQLNVGNNDRLQTLPEGLALIETLEELDITGCDLAPQLFESFASGAKKNGINIECVNRKPISKLVTKITVCSSLLLLSIWACVFTLPEVGLKFNTPTMTCSGTNTTSDTDVGALVDVCNSICFNDQFEQLLQSEETENCLSTCKMTTLVQLQLSQRTGESGTRNSTLCVSNDTESSWTPLTIFRLFATFVSVVFLLPELIDSGMMAWLFWRTRFSGTMLDTFERGNLLSQASEMLQDSWTYNCTGIWLSLLIGFWRVPCSKTEFKKENTSFREWVDYLAIAASVVDYVQTWALVPLSVGVVMTSSSFAEVIVNVVAVSVFSTLDDVFVEKIHKPQESLLNRWELYSGSKADLVRLGKLTLNRGMLKRIIRIAAKVVETKEPGSDIQGQDATSEVQNGGTLPNNEVSDEDDNTVRKHDEKIREKRGSTIEVIGHSTVTPDAPDDEAALDDNNVVESEINSDQHSLAKTEPEKGTEHVVIDIHEDVPHPSESASQPSEAVSQSTEPVSQPSEAAAQSSEAVSEPSQAISQPSEPVSQPNEATSLSRKTVSHTNDAVSQSSEASFQSNDTASQPTEAISQSNEAISQSSEAVSQPSEADSQSNEPIPQSNEATSPPSQSNAQSNEATSQSDVLDGMSAFMNGSGIQPKIQTDAAPTTGSASRKSLDETVSDNNDENAQTQDVNSMKLVNQVNNGSIDSVE